MLINKEDSKEIDQKIENIIASYNEEINGDEKLNYGIRLKATGAFVYRALLAKYKENQDDYNQEDVYREFAKIMRIEDKNLKSYELANLISEVAREGEPISDKIGDCAEKIKETYLDSNRPIYCVSSEKGLKKIEPIIRASNYYKAGTSEAIVGASNYEKILDEIAEECVEGKVKKAGKYIIYSKNPFKVDKKSEEIKLNKEITIYIVDSANFEPVLDYKMGTNYDGIISFEGEWISRAENEKVLEEVSVSTISKDFFVDRQVFVQNTNLDVIKQIEYNDDEEEVLNIIEMLIEEGELEYLNLDYNVGVDERLKNAKERSDKRKEIAKETIKLIDAKKIEEYLRKSIDYNKSELQELKELEIEAEDLFEEEKKSESVIATKKKMIAELFKINPIIGLRAGAIYLKHKKTIENITVNGTEKELVAFYVDNLVGKNKSPKEKSIITDLVYYQTKINIEDAQKEELKAIKDKNKDLLTLIYFKENGISEDSIYSFIIDCCDDDMEIYKNRMKRIKEIVENHELENIKFDVERYIASNKIAKQFKTTQKETKRLFKDIFRGNGKITLCERNNENKGNLERSKKEEKASTDNNSSIQLNSKTNSYKTEAKRQSYKKKTRDDKDI